MTFKKYKKIALGLALFSTLSFGTYADSKAPIIDGVISYNNFVSNTDLFICGDKIYSSSSDSISIIIDNVEYDNYTVEGNCLVVNSKHTGTGNKSLFLKEYDISSQKYMSSNKVSFEVKQAELKINNINIIDNKYIDIAGEGFRKGVIIYLNNRKISTRFISDRHVQANITKDMLKSNNLIYVQSGANKSNIYGYEAKVINPVILNVNTIDFKNEGRVIGVTMHNYNKKRDRLYANNTILKPYGNNCINNVCKFLLPYDISKGELVIGNSYYKQDVGYKFSFVKSIKPIVSSIRLDNLNNFIKVGGINLSDNVLSSNLLVDKNKGKVLVKKLTPDKTSFEGVLRDNINKNVNSKLTIKNGTAVKSINFKISEVEKRKDKTIYFAPEIYSIKYSTPLKAGDKIVLELDSVTGDEKVFIDNIEIKNINLNEGNNEITAYIPAGIKAGRKKIYIKKFDTISDKIEVLVFDKNVKTDFVTETKVLNKVLDKNKINQKLLRINYINTLEPLFSRSITFNVKSQKEKIREHGTFILKSGSKSYESLVNNAGILTFNNVLLETSNNDRYLELSKGSHFNSEASFTLSLDNIILNNNVHKTLDKEIINVTVKDNNKKDKIGHSCVGNGKVCKEFYKKIESDEKKNKDLVLANISGNKHKKKLNKNTKVNIINNNQNKYSKEKIQKNNETTKVLASASVNKHKEKNKITTKTTTVKKAIINTKVAKSLNTDMLSLETKLLLKANSINKFKVIKSKIGKLDLNKQIEELNNTISNLKGEVSSLKDSKKKYEKNELINQLKSYHRSVSFFLKS